ncbi:hypothetical protein T484DRAFT_1890061 [Baffinella frigidus]|nr:hypothetical protein T484DRAFT_1890061 [Cryptophyta sp. CCMP2293]
MRSRAIAALLAVVLMGAVEPCRDLLTQAILDSRAQPPPRRQAPCGLRLLRCVAGAEACRGNHAEADPSFIMQPLRDGVIVHSLRGGASSAYGDDTPMHALPDAPTSWGSARTASNGEAAPAFGGSAPDAMEDMAESPAGAPTPTSPGGGLASAGPPGGRAEGGGVVEGGFGGFGGNP